MSPTKPVIYRVETYIVPEVNKFPTQKTFHQIDVNQLVNRLKIIDEVASEDKQNANSENTSLISYDEDADISSKRIAEDIQKTCEFININFVKNQINKSDMNDEQLNNDDINQENKVGNFYTHYKERFNAETEFQASIKSQKLYPVKQFKRVNSLVSIDEKNECSNSEDKMSDLCYHGYKNGCTAIIPPPEEISEEVFKVNWLQKIEILRQREAAMTAKEVNLQIRERQLFRREKKIRILERVLKDKLKQTEQQPKQTEQPKQQRDTEKVDRVMESGEIKESQENDHPFEQANLIQMNDPTVEMEKRTITPSNSVDLYEETKHPAHLKSYLLRQFSSNTFSRPNSYSCMKYKERRKTSYDDLNSTLSADPGDSSFVRTSERFNPEVHKKPYIFTRSMSERWTNKQRDDIISAKTQDVSDMEQKSQQVIEEQKIFRKLSENINATQNKVAKFLNYGLVDLKPDNIPANLPSKLRTSINNEKLSYYDLGTENKTDRRKERPISWNEETNEWLQKKRQAYNLAIKKSIENKENKSSKEKEILKCNITEKDAKTSKKDVKKKIFTIFR